MTVVLPLGVYTSSRFQYYISKRKLTLGVTVCICCVMALIFFHYNNNVCFDYRRESNTFELPSPDHRLFNGSNLVIEFNDRDSYKILDLPQTERLLYLYAPWDAGSQQLSEDLELFSSSSFGLVISSGIHHINLAFSRCCQLLD